MSDTGKFTIVIPILNQFEEAAGYLDSWFALAKDRVNLIIIDNGSDEHWFCSKDHIRWVSEGHNVSVLTNPENVGVYPTFAQGYKAAIYTPWIFYSHSDVEMLVPGWDVRLREMLEVAHSRNAGVCGMFGAKGIGTPDLYKAPYAFTQMMRWDCHTVESMVDAGGTEVSQDLTRCMVLDGFSLIVRRDMVDVIGGFKHEQYPVHHMYDNDICLESHYAGFKNFVLDLDCVHHGGMTSTREKWAEKMGTTDLDVHRAAHVAFYDKWRGKIPVGV